MFELPCLTCYKIKWRNKRTIDIIKTKVITIIVYIYSSNNLLYTNVKVRECVVSVNGEFVRTTSVTMATSKQLLKRGGLSWLWESSLR